jgi:hypothetical protein
MNFIVIQDHLLIRCYACFKILEKEWEYIGTVRQLLIYLKKIYDSVVKGVQ